MFESTQITELAVSDAYRITPMKHPDLRGNFFEAYRADVLSKVIGYPFVLEQGNYSLSRRNTLRGIHSTTVPPGQAKLVTCVRGAVLDVVVDLRVGSPTFGRYDVVPLDEDSGVALYLADGLGHAYLALTDDACMSYLCSKTYEPGTMIEVSPLDPDIGIPWGFTEQPIMSEKDRDAPTLKEAEASGRLPTYADCLAHYAALRGGG
ncbi:dTDP-4-dehydrorhamnose 3,5-epimerase [Micromonospora sp. NPDC047793]|uniref:dTDP-4-dehydrorhamnose 3,5-epimerase family protein n=1 Tax=unclassified Micromonospora TaxID=2617518 RepID=UPI0010332A8B|nr:dTDP-4-dehydrorhamnose 3,5-epimerase [Verrucosispora sp. SN26_14.1]TBL45463.1 dTDP-4-keto-6-deoxy-D-glucose epimerase [Verrucosispora sp. SN26_14.1]